MKELSLIPSAVSESRWALHTCDKKCREVGFKCHQLAVIAAEGGATRAINLCEQCYNVRRLKQGEREMTASKWRERWLSSKRWAAFDMEQLKRKRWEGFIIKKSWARSVLADAESDK